MKNPVSPEGNNLPGAEDVTDKDPSEVGLLKHKASITIENTVYLGHDSGDSCESDIPTESVTGFADEDITYCLKISNSGNTHLNRVTVVDEQLSFRDSSKVGLLAPGDTVTIPVPRSLKKTHSNTATVTAVPSNSDGNEIDDAEPVSDEDPSEVAMKEALPIVEIDNKLYIGLDGGIACESDQPVDLIEGFPGEPLVYCFTVTNSGNTPLSSFTVTNEKLDFYDDTSIEALLPGESAIIPVTSMIELDLVNTAVVSATPTNDGGAVIPGIPDVTDSDPSEVTKKDHDAKVSILNTVYPGDDGGESCVSNIPKEHVTDFNGAPVTYCFKVINTGSTFLNNITISNHVLSFTDHSIPMLPPGGSSIVSLLSSIDGSYENIATVRAVRLCQSSHVYSLVHRIPSPTKGTTFQPRTM